MLTELQTSKLARRFELLDYDGDGVISTADYDLAARNICRAFGFEAGSPEHDRIQMTFNALWVRLSQATEHGKDGGITPEQFVASCLDDAGDPASCVEHVEVEISQTIFDLVDADSAGTLYVSELATWFSAYGVCEGDAEKAFRKVDRNKDGLLDREELLAAIRDYYTSDDPHAPGNALFGPLTVALSR